MQNNFNNYFKKILTFLLQQNERNFNAIATAKIIAWKIINSRKRLSLIGIENY